MDKREWIHKGFHGVLHFFSPGGMPVKPLMDYYGEACELTVFFLHDNLGDWYWNHADLTKLRVSFVKKVNEDPGVLDRYLADWQQRRRDLDDAMGKIEATDLSGLADDALVLLCVDFNRRYGLEFGISLPICDAFSMESEEFLAPTLRAIIEKKGRGAEFNALYESLLSPVDESFVTQEYRDRLRLAAIKDFGQLDEQGDQLLEEHAKKYHWMGNNYATDQNLGKEHFLKEMVSLQNMDIGAELKKLDSKLENVKRAKAKLMDELGLDLMARNLVRISEVFAYMQDERKKYALKSVHYQNKFLVEVAQRLDLSMEEARYTYVDELPGLFKDRTKVDRAALRERKSFVLVVNTLDGSEVIAGDVARQIFNQVFKLKEEQ